MPHLRRRALKQAAAAHSHQAVGGEHRICARQMQRQVTERMARDVIDITSNAAKRDAIPWVDGLIQGWQAMRVGSGADDPRGGLAQGAGQSGLQIGQPVNVIPMVMGQKYVGDGHIELRNFFHQRPGFRHVDNGRCAGGAVVDNIGIIV